MAGYPAGGSGGDRAIPRVCMYMRTSTWLPPAPFLLPLALGSRPLVSAARHLRTRRDKTTHNDAFCFSFSPVYSRRRLPNSFPRICSSRESMINRTQRETNETLSPLPFLFVCENLFLNFVRLRSSFSRSNPSVCRVYFDPFAAPVLVSFHSTTSPVVPHSFLFRYLPSLSTS